MRTWDRPHAHGPLISHVNPMRCAWATPPRCTSRGLRAHQGVNAQVQRFACEQHTAIDTESAKVQTHFLKVTDFRRFLPNGSAVWRAHRLTSQLHHHQMGEMASLEPRHADSQLLMLQNPHRSQPRAPRCIQDRHRVNFFALAPTSGRAGRQISRTERRNIATMKPTTPLLTPNTGPLKPTTPLRPKNAPKTPISHPQRRSRFQTTGPPRLQHPDAARVGGSWLRHPWAATTPPPPKSRT